MSSPRNQSKSSLEREIKRRIVNTTVLIPAAGRVADGVLALSNITCPAMVPVAGRPVIHWTISYLRSLGLRQYVIAVRRRGMFVEDFVECAFGQSCDITFIVPSTDGGVGRTVMELAEHADGRSALVVLGDTHFQFSNPGILSGDQPTVLVHPVEDSYRWCTAEFRDDGEIEMLRDKEVGLAGPLNALIGVYYFPDLSELRSASRAAVNESQNGSRGTEMAEILNQLRRKIAVRAVTAEAWLDCGNPDRQASSQRSLLQKRAFNELSINDTLGTISKRSRHVEKFLDEINYLRLLPPDLAVLFPRVVSHSIDWDDPGLTLEYYGYPTLAEIFVFENVDPAIWEQIFIHLRDILLSGFMKHSHPLRPDVVREMYFNKTRERLEQLRDTSELRGLMSHEESVTINGRPVANLPPLWETLEKEVDRLSENVRGCVIHGDLCFSNVLYDLRSRICKFLDPRGSFGIPGIYGDPRYDVAKLYHSVYGLYDFIVNDLFHVHVDGPHVELDIRFREQHQEIRERFERVFFEEFDRREILLLTGLLFASMPALHFDTPNRQLAMYARALQLLDEVFCPEASIEQEAIA